MGKKKPFYYYHLVKRRSWWDGTTYAWCGFTASAKDYRDNAYVFVSLRSDGVVCPDCKAAKRGGRR